ncbi:MAG TPA: PDR/VanB family oxidoreductase, partial [Pseudolysinimonas sp.]|nr:PDR/VanB family oxidoreductase [Pseudolysinimonas sp.]
GGSLHMHRLAPGDTVHVSRPRSAFAPVSNASHHVLIAAGIGLTPILSHVRSAATWGRSATVLYIHREESPVHVETLEALGELHPPVSVQTFTSRDAFAHTLQNVLVSQPLGSHLYVCGPGGFMDAVLTTARDHGWPNGRLHSESFGLSSLEAGEPFTARIAGTDEVVEVPSGVSLLEALENAGIGVPNLCRQGVCGECRLTVTSGTPLHRDLYLDEQEKATNVAIMACVSRSVHAELEVAL